MGIAVLCGHCSFMWALLFYAGIAVLCGRCCFMRALLFYVGIAVLCGHCCFMRALLFFFTLGAVLLATSQYSEGPATGHLDTGFSWFPCVYKQMLRWFPTFQVATTCFLCSPPDLNLLVTDFIFCIHVK